MRPTARDSARVSLWACLLGAGSLSWHVRPGPPVLHVRATRTGLPRTVRTQRRRAACPQGPTCCTYWVRVPASGVPCLPRSMVSTAGTSGDGAVKEPGPNPHPNPEPKPKPNPGSTWRRCSIRTFASKYGTSAGRCVLDPNPNPNPNPKPKPNPKPNADEHPALLAVLLPEHQRRHLRRRQRGPG